jgi:hypothetical protein
MTRLTTLNHAAMSGYQLEEIPVRNFFRAVHGFGKGDVAPASYSKVRDLLLSKKIVVVDGDPVGQPERTLVRRLILEDGTQLHFDSSSHGACCYYIEEPGPSCVEVFDREQPNVVPNEAAGTVADSYREEAGRAYSAAAKEHEELSRRASVSARTTAPQSPNTKPLSVVSETREVPPSSNERTGGRKGTP